MNKGKDFYVFCYGLMQIEGQAKYIRNHIFDGRSYSASGNGFHVNTPRPHLITHFCNIFNKLIVMCIEKIYPKFMYIIFK